MPRAGKLCRCARPFADRRALVHRHSVDRAVPCEMLGVSNGLGYFILDIRDRLAYSELIAMVLLISALGFALDAGARASLTR